MATIEIKDLEKQRKQLKASFDMWEKTIKETIDSMKSARREDNTKKYSTDEINDRVETLRNGEQDIIDKWVFLGGTLDELKDFGKSEKPVVKKKTQTKTVGERIEEASKNKKGKEKTEEVKDESEFEDIHIQESVSSRNNQVSKYIPKMDDSNPLASYDIIPLPSNGECYKDKKGRIAVSYLTAMDENIIVSPNLYRDNMVLDVILKEKIRDPEIDPDDLLDGDRDAIILFLRSSAYGNMYSVTTTDPDTRTPFETKIDLSKIKYKEFNLTGDENGYFDFKMPISKDDIKFKFLTHKDYLNLAKLDEVEVGSIRKAEIDKYNGKLKYYLDEDETLTDRKFIHEYVKNMPIKDSSALRKYISKNTPGVDYNFEVEKPESLGGGSMQVFLQFDQFIFLADSE